MAISSAPASSSLSSTPSSLTAGLDATTRWSTERANEWYARQPWLVGANFIPSNAINQLEMFQAATFDPALNDYELSLAASLGMNTVRVFLHDQLWLADPAGTRDRIDHFLTIAARHGIRTMLVLFDSCWENDPHLGPQHPPIPGIHNSGWVQSPGKRRLHDLTVEPELQRYVQDVVRAFAHDTRILAWDLWNEPDNKGGDLLVDVPAKVARINQLLPRVFAWAREINPTQPLTSGVWDGNWTDPARATPTTLIQLAESDIITFHDYNWPELFEASIASLRPHNRPILCTEYMARGIGSTFDTHLPIAKRLNVAVFNWGLVVGKTQTHIPWDSWQRPYVDLAPAVWFHEIFRSASPALPAIPATLTSLGRPAIPAIAAGTPYRQREADLMRELTGRGAPTLAERQAAAASPNHPVAPIAPTEHAPITTPLAAAAIPAAHDLAPAEHAPLPTDVPDDLAAAQLTPHLPPPELTPELAATR